MKTLQKTTAFDKWLTNLKDKRALAKILFRLQKLQRFGHPGDFKTVGEGIKELKINYAKGYRVYYKEIGHVLILLLIGGDKSTQKHDIKKAKQLWKAIQIEHGNNKF